MQIIRSFPAMKYDEVNPSKNRTTPLLLRRRLSAPETIMRKHVLAQQRSSSQDSHKSTDSDSNTSWHGDTSLASDTNLSKRRNPDIRKSTLMKRFWESSKTNLSVTPFPSSFAEWQHGGYRTKAASIRSLVTDSPKQSRGLHFTQSPHSPRHSPHHHHLPFQPQPTSQQSSSLQSPSDVTYSPFATTATNIPKSEEDSYLVYSSTDRIARTDVSDSYPMSTRSESVNSVANHFSSSPSVAPSQSNQVVQATKTYKITKNGIDDVTNGENIPILPIKYQFTINEDHNQYDYLQHEQKQEDCSNGNRKESGKTNLNVITNVQLSQSTLNTIFNQVMQDVLHTQPTNTETLENNITKQKAYNFKVNLYDAHLKTTSESISTQEKHAEDYLQVDDSSIGEINVGSPYKTSRSPTVPRLSALPRTSSMEVNISSNESMAMDSDTSLVDSLDDPASPRVKIKQQTNISHNITKAKILSRVNDLHAIDAFDDDADEIIEKEEIKKSTQKSSVFYIPIDDSAISESDSHVVSDMLPNKLKQRLLQRQIKREEKRLEERMKAFDTENGNTSGCFSTSPETVTPLKKKPIKSSRKGGRINSKTTLPQIDLSKDYSKGLRADYTQRSLNRYRESVETFNSNLKKAFMLPKTNQKHNKQSMNKKKTKGSSTSSSKHIEILEIMEIVEPERSIQLTSKSKSKIPVFQHSSAETKLPKLKPKPTFLDFGEVGQPGDPKLDQLIANILIDTLNHEDIKDQQRFLNGIQAVPRSHRKEDDRTVEEPRKLIDQSNNYNSANNNPSLIEQAASILSKQVLDNNNLSPSESGAKMLKPVEVNDHNSLHPINVDDIPKGWITFYMLQKHQSPDSTSDEDKMAKTVSKGTQCVSHDVRSKTQKVRLQSKEYREKEAGRKPDGWSITVSNNNNELKGEVEMKFKFPSLSCKAQKSNRKPIKTSGLQFANVCNNNYQSEIYKSKQYLRNPSTVKVRRRQYLLSPRPTKTSKQRTLLHRQRHVHNLREENLEDNNLPHILSISGSSLHQIRRLPNMNELLLKKLLTKWNQEHPTDEEVNTAIKQSGVVHE